MLPLYFSICIIFAFDENKINLCRVSLYSLSVYLCIKSCILSTLALFKEDTRKKTVQMFDSSFFFVITPSLLFVTRIALLTSLTLSVQFFYCFISNSKKNCLVESCADQYLCYSQIRSRWNYCKFTQMVQNGLCDSTLTFDFNQVFEYQRPQSEF